MQGKEGIGFYIAFNSLIMSYRDEIVTQNREEILFSSRTVAGGLSVPKGL